MTELTFVLLDEGLEGFLRRFPAPDPEVPAPIELTDTRRYETRMRRLERASGRYLEERTDLDEWPEPPTVEANNMHCLLGCWEGE